MMSSSLAALIGLALAIVLIIKKISPVYSLMIGALAGGLLGCGSIVDTVGAMFDGVKSITPAVLRIIAAGVLSGALIESGAAASIAQTIVHRLGPRFVYFSLALATMILCAVGVFVDVAVITVAPVALALSSRLELNPAKLLLAMIGGGKCGNIMSPNPNTIVAAENYDVPLSSVMAAGILPALIGLAVTVFVIIPLIPSKARSAGSCPNTGSGSASGEGSVPTSGNGASCASAVPASGEDASYTASAAVDTASVKGALPGNAPDSKNGTDASLPSFWASIAGPVVTILILALRPAFGIVIDPMIALPSGGLVTLAATRCLRKTAVSLDYGLSKMAPVALLLVGTGTLAGVISASDLKDVVITFLQGWNVGGRIMAPFSSILMAAATASTTAGATIASASFSDAVLGTGFAGVWAAALTNAGATVLDHLPHGSFFHATAGSVSMPFRQRLGLIPFESLVGLALTLAMLLCSYLPIF